MATMVCIQADSVHSMGRTGRQDWFHKLAKLCMHSQIIQASLPACNHAAPSSGPLF